MLGAQQPRTAVRSGCTDGKCEQLERHGMYRLITSETKSAYTVKDHDVSHIGDTDNNDMDMEAMPVKLKANRAKKFPVVLVGNALATSLQFSVVVLSLYDRSGNLATGTWKFRLAFLSTMSHFLLFLRVTYVYCKV
jgi:hypothetical protein